jgi:fructoselysine-6-P-deglycase FrlB-like protein/hydroxymethylpyrimidine pyrophosphatase-like HAD family hydrolase
MALGKAFAGELKALPQTYSWAVGLPVDALAAWVRSASVYPLIAVGSGGSFTSALFACYLHTLYTGRVAKAITPLELVASTLYPSETDVLLLSAGGGNPDILACVEALGRCPPSRIGVVCTREGSQLAEAARSLPKVSLHEHEPPTGKDGFLATNSLLATSVLLARAYSRAWSADAALPEDLSGLMHSARTESAFRAELEVRCRPLWERATTVVLHGHVTQAAALDLESKFTEAAIGYLQTADYRNFAHGRHHWLAKHGESTGVLALVSPEDRSLADRTLRVLPDSIPVVRLDFDHTGVASALAGIAAGMYFVGLAGTARGIDPGRPTVATFGRRLYHLGGLTPAPLPELLPQDVVAIERKAGLRITTLSARHRLDKWRRSLSDFKTSLRGVSFGAIVCDYDGTLCGATERWTGPAPEIAELLGELLQAEILLGVATGRGQSVRNDLRRILADRGVWGNVLVGYHNGGEIGWLADDTQPPAGELDASLRAIIDAIRYEGQLTRMVKVEAKLRQVTLELSPEADEAEVWLAAERLVRRHAPAGVTLVRSSHSVDILAPGVSKRLLVDRVRVELARSGRHTNVLCIGDKGNWPGNDFALLEEPHSLSVDEVSPDPSACWNLAPPGERCVAAALTYLRSFRVSAGRFTVEL